VAKLQKCFETPFM